MIESLMKQLQEAKNLMEQLQEAKKQTEVNRKEIVRLEKLLDESLRE